MRRSMIRSVAFALTLGGLATGTPSGGTDAWAASVGADRDALASDTIGLMIENAGPGQAEALLGTIYLRGMRIDPDPVAAMAWLERAAAAGHPAGIYAAARMYAEGLGVPADAGRARQFLSHLAPAEFGSLAPAVEQLRQSLGMPAVADGPPADTVNTVAGPGASPAAIVLPTAEPPAPAGAERPVPPPLPPYYAQIATVFDESRIQHEIEHTLEILPPKAMKGHELISRPTKARSQDAWLLVVTGFESKADVKTFCDQAVAVKLSCVVKGQ